jgi:hypothetical protein
LIETQENKPMNVFPLKSLSANPKSPILNQKWLRLWVIVLMLVVAKAGAQAQQPKKVSRIGYLSANEAANESTRTEILRQALRELG